MGLGMVYKVVIHSRIEDQMHLDLPLRSQDLDVGLNTKRNMKSRRWKVSNKNVGSGLRTSAPQNTDLEMYAKPNTDNNAETGPIRNVTMYGEMNATREPGRSAMNIPDLYRFLMLKMNVPL